MLVRSDDCGSDELGVRDVVEDDEVVSDGLRLVDEPDELDGDAPDADPGDVAPGDELAELDELDGLVASVAVDELDALDCEVSLEVTSLDDCVDEPGVLADGSAADELEAPASDCDAPGVASATRHDSNSVRSTAPSPSVSAVAKLGSSSGAAAASVAVTLPSASLSSVSNEALPAGSAASAVKAQAVAAMPLINARVFIVGLLSERLDSASGKHTHANSALQCTEMATLRRRRGVAAAARVRAAAAMRRVCG